MITLGFKPRQNKNPRRRRRSELSLFLQLCEHLVYEFVQEQGGQDFDVFVARDGGAVRLYVMTRAEAYDFDLSRKLSEFAVPYIELGVIESATLIPASSTEELGAFFDPTKALRIEIQHA